MNHTEGLHPRAAIRGLKRPRVLTKLVAVGSVEAQLWDEWLAAKGYPPLSRIGHRIEGQFEMPVTAAPEESNAIGYRIALDWAEWLRSKA